MAHSRRKYTSEFSMHLRDTVKAHASTAGDPTKGR